MHAETKTFQFNKLIRDQLDKVLEEKGITINKKTLSPQELKIAFDAKLLEETNEVTRAVSKNEILEELADLFEVITAYANFQQVSLAEIEEVRKQKKEKRGGFETGLFIESIEIHEDNPACSYYQSRPKQYPEIKQS